MIVASRSLASHGANSRDGDLGHRRSRLHRGRAGAPARRRGPRGRDATQAGAPLRGAAARSVAVDLAQPRPARDGSRGAIVVCSRAAGPRSGARDAALWPRSAAAASSTSRRPACTRPAVARGSTRAGRSRRRRASGRARVAAEAALCQRTTVDPARRRHPRTRPRARRAHARRHLSHHRRRSRARQPDPRRRPRRGDRPRRARSTATGAFNVADDDPAPIGEVADALAGAARPAAASARRRRARSIPRSPAC